MLCNRSIEGYPLRPRFDLFGELRDGLKELFTWDEDPNPRDRFEAGLPTPVYSCFNGMAVFDARPFLPKEVGGDAIRFRSGRVEEGECPQVRSRFVSPRLVPLPSSFSPVFPGTDLSSPDSILIRIERMYHHRRRLLVHQLNSLGARPSSSSHLRAHRLLVRMDGDACEEGRIRSDDERAGEGRSFDEGEDRLGGSESSREGRLLARVQGS